ncbi:unnamed protein product [Peniophora sp. CBMAI 1063]|nr:unnamed protein product [Peniophora sp. CBMAI 1063]
MQHKSPNMLSMRHKGVRVLVKWPETYEKLLEAARIAYPGLPTNDAKIYFETRVILDDKDHRYSYVNRRTKNKPARVTPEVWTEVPPPTGPREGTVNEVEVRTLRKAWGLLRVYQLGRTRSGGSEDTTKV